MKRCLLLVLLFVGMLVAGCGMAHTPRERRLRRRNVHRYGFRQIMDDWDYFWLVDEPSNLTRYDIRDAD